MTQHHAVGDETVARLAHGLIEADDGRAAGRTPRGDTPSAPGGDPSAPGVGAPELRLRDGLSASGSAAFLVLMALVAFDELESAALGVLAPELRDSFGVGNGAIVVISSAAGAFIVLGTLPMGWLADRYPRGRIAGCAGVAFGVLVALCGLAGNIFQFFLARLGVGVAKSANLPVGASLLADTYPVGVRGRLGAAHGTAARAAGMLSPLAVGGIAGWAGGDEGWRWAFLLLGLPSAIAGLAALRLPEPERGRHERAAVLGESATASPDASSAEPVSVEAAFARLNRIATLKGMIAACSALGFGLFTVPVLANLFVEQRYGASAFERGLASAAAGAAALVVLPLVGRRFDRLYRRDPARALAVVGYLVMPAGLLMPVQYAMPNLALFTLALTPGAVAMSTALTMLTPALQSVVPYKLRGMGAAMASVHIFFVGATGGALLSALLADQYGPRVATLLICVPATVVGGAMMLRSSASIRDDLALVVAELREEEAENRRLAEAPGDVPALHLSEADVSYGPVRILFGVSLEVRRGEILALLGTNGAGKSTALRALAGLVTPTRGVVRMDGRDITFTTPERRGRLGVRLLPGGKGVFPELTVRRNLEAAAFAYRRDPADRERRIARALARFPDLADRQDTRADALSGGRQQLLALAMVLVHDPEVLLVDELSLGLAPVTVQELLGVLEELRDDGVGVVIVEQSLDLALSVADRAVFLDKGRVRFSGPAAELAARDDLAKAVFLGAAVGTVGGVGGVGATEGAGR
ncbi:ATP-binding protein [Yinghuangia seranimata]|uniref:ATP-binding protein n=1 Tax=Yinghuangia seranimata TaxID=408067 RepID=UPI00248C71EB|nr:ATP-binding protein [Yinghuangia seranimata]MDI2124608.1 ATP-binding protein [Yinghuangia seranimata]